MDSSFDWMPLEHHQQDEGTCNTYIRFDEDAYPQYTPSDYSASSSEQASWGPDANLNLQPQAFWDLGRLGISSEANQHLDRDEYILQNRWNPEQHSDQDLPGVSSSFDCPPVGIKPQNSNNDCDIPNADFVPQDSIDVLSTTKDFLATFRTLGDWPATAMAVDMQPIRPLHPQPPKRQFDKSAQPMEPKPSVQNTVAPHAHLETLLSFPPSRASGGTADPSRATEPDLIAPDSTLLHSRVTTSREEPVELAEICQPEIILQHETRPISQEQLVAEVKGIYAGLVMVENRCIEADSNLASTGSDSADRASQLNNNQWQALISLHRTLLHEHHDFFLAPYPNNSLRRLTKKWTRTFSAQWRSAFDTILECLESQKRKPLSFEEALNLAYINLSFSKILWKFSHRNSRENLAQKLQSQWCLNSKELFSKPAENSGWETLQEGWKADIRRMLKPHQVAPPNIQYVSMHSSWDIKYALEIPILFFKNFTSRISGHIHIALEGLHRAANDTKSPSNTRNASDNTQSGSMWVLYLFAGLLKVAERLGFEREVEFAYILVQKKWLKCQEDVKEFLRRRLTGSSNEAQPNVAEFRNHLDDKRKSIKRRHSEEDISEHDQQRPKFSHCCSDPVPPGQLFSNLGDSEAGASNTTRASLDGQKIEADNQRFYCDRSGCNFSATNKGNIRRHILEVHEGKKYLCKVKGCGKTFGRSDHLRSHQRHAHKIKFKEDLISEIIHEAGRYGTSYG